MLNYSGLQNKVIAICFICVLGVVICLIWKSGKRALRIILAIICILVFIAEIFNYLHTKANLDTETIVGKYIKYERIGSFSDEYHFAPKNEEYAIVLYLDPFSARKLGLGKIQEGNTYRITYEKKSRIILAIAIDNETS